VYRSLIIALALTSVAVRSYASSQIETAGVIAGTPVRIKTLLTKTGDHSLRAVADLSVLADLPSALCANAGIGITCTRAGLHVEEDGTVLITAPISTAVGLTRTILIRISPRLSEVQDSIFLDTSLEQASNDDLRLQTAGISRLLRSELQGQVDLAWFLDAEHLRDYRVSSCGFIRLDRNGRIGLILQLTHNSVPASLSK